jgi:hypothetical protein
MTDYNTGRASGIREAAEVASSFGCCHVPNEIAADILALLDAPAPAGVTIKPLVWGYHPEGAIAAPPTGHAYIIDTRMKGRVYSIKGFNPAREFESKDEAKAAAQADYEARIMAALEPAPAGVTVPDELYQAAKRDAEEAEAYAAELEAKLQDMALDCLAAQGQAEEAYQAQLVAEAEIDRLRQLIPRPEQTEDELVWRDHMRGVPLAALAKEFGVTKERMRHRLKRIAENRLHLTGDRGASG